MSRKSLALSIGDESSVGAVRRAVTSLAIALGFDDTERGSIAIVASELATNVLRHGKGGQVLLRALGTSDLPGVEILALDKGPGIRDLNRAFGDGYSTAGTSGTGLGAVSRLSTIYDVDSAPGRGTAVLSRTWRGAVGRRGFSDPEAGIGVVCVPRAGEDACGDDWAVIPRQDRSTLCIVADGLGHGADAAKASATAIRVADAEQRLGTVAIIECAHAAMRSTRGAAVAVAAIEPTAERVRFAGIGNVAAMVASKEGIQNLVSHNGTVGHEMRRAAEFVYRFPPGATLLLMSDGLSTHARPDAYQGLLFKHPSILAGVLYRDFTRGRDDATVVAWRVGEPRR